MKKSEPQIIDVRSRDEHYIARKITNFVNDHCVTSNQSFVILLVNLDKNKIDFKILAFPDIDHSTRFIRVYSLVDLNKKLLVCELEKMCLDLSDGYDNQCRYVFRCDLEFLHTAKDIPQNKEKGYPEFIRRPVPVQFEPTQPYSYLSLNIFDKCINYCKNAINPCKLSFEQLKKQRELDDAKLALRKPNKKHFHDTNVKMMRQSELEAYRVRQGLPLA